MKVLVTGGAGFIGSHLADRLVARGDEILIIDNLSTGRRDSVPDHPSVTFVEGDIAADGICRSLMAEFHPDVVVHAAASYKDPDDWVGDSRTNVLGTVNVVRAAQAAGTSRIIYLQTALTYGLHPKEQPITLSHPIESGNSSYAISKTAAEQYIQLSGLDWVTFRLANAYGPRNISGPLPTFFLRLTQGKGCFVVNTRRDFIYISDLIDCMVPAVDGKGHGAYHISSGGDVSIAELYEATVQALDIVPVVPVEHRERHPDDAFSILLDPSRSVAEFDWAVHTPLREGVAKAIDWYRSHGVTQTFTHLKA